MVWTRIFEGDFFSLETNFAGGVFLRDRALLRVTIERERNADIIITYPHINQTMSYDKGDGVVVIDITDYVRAFPSTGETPIVVGYFDDAEPIEWTATQFANVNTEIIPQKNTSIANSVSVFPPRLIYENLFGVLNQYELYVDTGAVLAKNDGETREKRFGTGLHEFTMTTDFSLYGSAINGDIHFKQKPLVCGRQYAIVEWQSRFGKTKRATWEVAEVKNSATDIVELVNIYGGWKTRKGSEVSVVLRLRDLTPYDYWYYCDIITSNDVRVALNEIDEDLDERTIVDIVTKSVTMPNSGVKTLEVEIKYRKYGCPI